MSLVLDSSVALSWVFEDENSEPGTAVFRDVVQSGAIVPSLWRLEVANVLLMAVRRKRIDAAFRDASLADLGALDIEIDALTSDIVWSDTMRIAERYGLTIYDATYLELALRRGATLATLDRGLDRAARSAGVDTRGC